MLDFRYVAVHVFFSSTMHKNVEKKLVMFVLNIRWNDGK